MKKLIHYFDKTTKLFTEDGLLAPEPQKDLKAKPVYKIPANATTIQPVGLYKPKWTGKKWIEAEDPKVIAAVKAQANTPPPVSAMSAKIALENIGKLAAIETYMQTATKQEQIAWSSASTFSRTSPMLATVTEALGMTSADVDSLFKAAAKIVV